MEGEISHHLSRIYLALRLRNCPFLNVNVQEFGDLVPCSAGSIGIGDLLRVLPHINTPIPNILYCLCFYWISKLSEELTWNRSTAIICKSDVNNCYERGLAINKTSSDPVKLLCSGAQSIAVDATTITQGPEAPGKVLGGHVHLTIPSIWKVFSQASNMLPKSRNERMLSLEQSYPSFWRASHDCVFQ